MTEEQIQDIEFCKKILIDEIEKIKIISDKLKRNLTPEVLMSIIYLKFFSDCTIGRKFQNVEESFKFLNDIEGVIEKIYYIDSYLKRVDESLKVS